MWATLPDRIKPLVCRKAAIPPTRNGKPAKKAKDGWSENAANNLWLQADSMPARGIGGALLGLV
jgi:hypothetical protein